MKGTEVGCAFRAAETFREGVGVEGCPAEVSPGCTSVVTEMDELQAGQLAKGETAKVSRSRSFLTLPRCLLSALNITVP